MKKLFSMFVCLIAIMFFVACDDDNKEKDKGDTADTEAADTGDTESADTGDTGDTEAADTGDTDTDTGDTDTDTDPCAEVKCDDENASCVVDEETGEGKCECVEGMHFNAGKCISDTEMTEIGTFTMDFTGAINETITIDGSMMSGEGDAAFTYLDSEFTYGSVIIDLTPNMEINVAFPTAANGFLKEGISIVWTEDFDINNVFTTGSLRFIAVNIPQTLDAAEEGYDFVENEIFTFYGDLSLDVMGGNIAPKCVRAVSGAATLNIVKKAESNIAISAEGALIDPAYAQAQGYELPYEICAE